MRGPGLVVCLGIAVVVMLLVAGAHKIKYVPKIRDFVILCALWQVGLFVILLIHSQHVGYFDFDWADQHLMAWAGMGVMPIPIAVIAIVPRPWKSAAQPDSE